MRRLMLQFSDMAFDVLTIGDTVIDAFIRIKDARVTCDINNENCMLSMRFGDKIPFEFDEIIPGVGNSSNAAVACARLGLATTTRVSVGRDENGKKCLASFEANGVDISLVLEEEGKKTNYHYVLWYESERTILIKHEHFTYSMPKLSEPPKWIYLSSLGEGTLPYHQEIIDYCKANPEVKMVFQPGTFQIKSGVAPLKELYEHSEIVFCNKEEAQRILNIKEEDIKKLLSGIRALGPKVAVITDGREGSYVMNDEGAWHAPMYPDPKPPLERTGAGDATASTTMAYLAKGLSLSEAILRGHINSASVVQEIGAQKGLLSAEQIEEWYGRRPTEFKATELE